MPTLDRWRSSLLAPALIALIIGMLGIGASYILLLTASPRLSIAGYDATTEPLFLVLIGAMLVAALGSDALLIRGRFRGWAKMPRRNRTIHVIGTALLVLFVETVCAFATGTVFTVI
jgi:hypothetical protein